jgi:hypothetical protein
MPLNVQNLPKETGAICTSGGMKQIVLSYPATGNLPVSDRFALS